MRTLGASKTRAFTLLELLLTTIVLSLAMLIFAAAFSRNQHARVKAIRINCASNLKQVGLSFEVWAGDNNNNFPMQVSTNGGGTMELGATNVADHFRAISNELNTPKVLCCPGDEKRDCATNFLADLNNSHVSYFIGIDANKTNATMLLAGDRNLTVGNTAPYNSVVVLSNQSVGWTKEIHNLMGNVVLADGSVQQVTTSALRAYLIGSGVATNRLAFP
jgi:type II secretory pathway pseudopilin PulG